MVLTKVKVTNSLSWCSCCGTPAETGDDLIKVEVAGSVRYIKLTHLVSWSALSGSGEKLSLNKKAKPRSEMPVPAQAQDLGESADSFDRIHGKFPQ